MAAIWPCPGAQTTVTIGNVVVYFYPTSTTSGWNTPDPTDRISKATRRILEMQREMDELAQELRRSGDAMLFLRLARLENERRARSDRHSRARRAPAKTQRKTTQRLQTAQAAMDARLAAGCCR